MLELSCINPPWRTQLASAPCTCVKKYTISSQWKIFFWCIPQFFSQVKFILSNNLTHTKDSYRGITAKKLGIPIVDLSYLNNCINEKSLLELDKYLVLSDTEKLEFGTIGKFCICVNCIQWWKLSADRPPDSAITKSWPNG